MFTGIVQGVATIVEMDRKPGLIANQIKFPASSMTGIAVGASVSIDGACMTVTRISGDTLGFDVMAESLEKTTWGSYAVGSSVNFERSLKMGDELGGHMLSGHVDGTAKISAIEKPENNFTITFSVSPQWMRYIFAKGYIALNGASLTVASVNKATNSFTVFLIPETLRLTTFVNAKAGDFVNFEIERQTQVMVDTVTNFLEDRLAGGMQNALSGSEAKTLPDVRNKLVVGLDQAEQIHVKKS